MPNIRMVLNQLRNATVSLRNEKAAVLAVHTIELAEVVEDQEKRIAALEASAKAKS